MRCTRLLSGIAAAICICASSSASAAAQLDGTQSKVSASERVPLISLFIPALERLGSTDRTAAGCLGVVSNPVVMFRQGSELEIRRDGSTMDNEVSGILSSNAGKIIGCSVAFSMSAEKISEALRSKKPTRAKAIGVIEEILRADLAASYNDFKKMNQAAYDVLVFITAGNNGHAKPYIRYNDISGVWHSNEVSGTSATATINGGTNAAISSAGPIREIITDGVFNYFSNPVLVASKCANRTCADTFSVKFDGNSLDVKKNGQRWLDSEVIGGAIYAIELSAEKSTSTTKKVDR